MKHKQKTKQNENKKRKKTTFAWVDDEVELLLKTTATILRLFSKATPFEKKWALGYWFRQRDCTCTWSIIYRVGKPFLIALETVAEKIRIHVHTQKRSGSETSVFERSTFGSVFEKLRFGVQAFSKSSGYVRIRVTGSMYPGSKSSVFEKTRVERVHVAWVWVWLQDLAFCTRSAAVSMDTAAKSWSCSEKREAARRAASRAAAAEKKRRLQRLQCEKECEVEVKSRFFFLSFFLFFFGKKNFLGKWGPSRVVLQFFLFIFCCWSLKKDGNFEGRGTKGQLLALQL